MTFAPGSVIEHHDFEVSARSPFLRLGDTGCPMDHTSLVGPQLARSQPWMDTELSQLWARTACCRGHVSLGGCAAGFADHWPMCGGEAAWPRAEPGSLRAAGTPGPAQISPRPGPAPGLRGFPGLPAHVASRAGAPPSSPGDPGCGQPRAWEEVASARQRLERTRSPRPWAAARTQG